MEETGVFEQIFLPMKYTQLSCSAVIFVTHLGASVHMIGTTSICSSIMPIFAYQPVLIVTISCALYVICFPADLLSMSPISHTFNYRPIFLAILFHLISNSILSILIFGGLPLLPLHHVICITLSLSKITFKSSESISSKTEPRYLLSPPFNEGYHEEYL